MLQINTLSTLPIPKALPNHRKGEQPTLTALLWMRLFVNIVLFDSHNILR